MMRRWYIWVMLGLVLSITAPVAAVQTRLYQTIDPIYCTYTNVATGTIDGISTTCDNQNVPTVTAATATDGWAVLSGTFTSANSIQLRVWVNGQWYTLGITPALTTHNDTWTLDLRHVGVRLSAGTYDVVVEELTANSFLLRSNYTAVLSVSSYTIVTTTTETGSSAPTVVTAYGGGSPYGVFRYTLVDGSLDVLRPASLLTVPSRGAGMYGKDFRVTGFDWWWLLIIFLVIVIIVWARRYFDSRRRGY